jgi:hypothetical protein
MGQKVGLQQRMMAYMAKTLIFSLAGKNDSWFL